MSDPHRYQELREALLGGTLTGAGSRELLELFRSRPDLLDELAQSIAIDRLLDLAAEDPDDAVRFPNEVIQRIQTAPQADAFADSVRHRLKPKRRPITRWALPLAAAITLLAVGTWFFQRDTALARVTAQSDLQWRDTSALVVGDELQRGQTIAIDGGLIALTLPGRGEAVLEGPAVFSIVGAKRFKLDRGRATFTVTKGGRGLTVATPHGTAVDLGTAFALNISPESGDLHVIKGRVRFTDNDGASQTLDVGNALREDDAGQRAIPADGNQFVWQMPGRDSSDGSFVFWSGREDRGDASAATGEASSDPLILKSATPDGTQPRWATVDGRRGLEFDGQGAYAQSNWTGLGGDTPRTVALWVRVPASWTPEDGGSLVSWGRFEWPDHGIMFDLTLNRDPAKGPLGAPHLDVHGATATAGVDLRDDQWHHLAVTTYQHDDGTSPTQVLFYLDGHLVPSSPRALTRLDTITSDEERRGILIGRSVRSINSPTPTTPDFFPGMVSEIMISSGAMNADAIRDLMSTGTP